MAKRAVVGHRHQRGFPVARVPLDADLLRIDCRISLKIIERAARAPGPCAQSAPVVRLARLALVGQSDDPFRQAGAVVRLHAGGNVLGVTPAAGKHLLLPGWSRRGGANCGNRFSIIAMNSRLKPSSMITGTGPGRWRAWSRSDRCSR